MSFRNDEWIPEQGFEDVPPQVMLAKHTFVQQQRLATQGEREGPAMKKKIALLCTAAVMIAVLAVGGTLAYLVDKTDTATNTFMIGEVTGLLTENGTLGAVGEDSVTHEPDNILINWDKVDPLKDGDFAGIPLTATGIAPGQLVQKAPVVTLGGDSRAAYVRLTVTGVDFSTLGNKSALYFTPVGSNIGAGASQWTYGGEDADGNSYFYYNSILINPEDPEDSLAATTPLFTSVQLKSGVVNETLGNIAVYAELIQASYLGDGVDSAEEAFALYDDQETPPAP